MELYTVETQLYSDINRHLNGLPATPFPAKLRQFTKLLYAGVQEQGRSIPIERNSKLYRGVGYDFRQHGSGASGTPLKKGDRFRLNGFTSFSLRGTVAEQFATQDQGDIMTVLETIIEAPCHTGYFIAHLAHNTVNGEEEVLFLPGSCWEVENIEENPVQMGCNCEAVALQCSNCNRSRILTRVVIRIKEFKNPMYRETRPIPISVAEAPPPPPPLQGS